MADSTAIDLSGNIEIREPFLKDSKTRITSPLLLIAIAASLGACYIIKLKNKDNRIKILGHELKLAQQYILVALCSVPIFMLVGAGSAIFWILGASFFLIMLHATFFAIESLPQDDTFELTMETI